MQNFSLRNLLFRLLGLTLLGKEFRKVMGWLLHHFQEEFNTRLYSLLFKSLLLLLAIVLLQIALLFALIGLALYLNELFQSAYIGFFMLSGGIVGLFVLWGLLSRLIRLLRRFWQ